MSSIGECVIDISFLRAGPTGSIFSIQVSPAPCVSSSVYQITAVPEASGAATVAPSNFHRKGMFIFNDASGSMYVRYGPSASLSNGGAWSVIIPGREAQGDAAADKASRNWTMPYPIWQGDVTAVWDSTVKFGDHCHVTELT